MIIKMYVEGNVQNQMFTLQMSQVNNLSSTEPNFKKKKKTQKSHRRQPIIKVRENGNKSQFFVKINKTDKLITK